MTVLSALSFDSGVSKVPWRHYFDAHRRRIEVVKGRLADVAPAIQKRSCLVKLDTPHAGRNFHFERRLKPSTSSNGWTKGALSIPI